jgi:hypothetical protein
MAATHQRRPMMSIPLPSAHGRRIRTGSGQRAPPFRAFRSSKARRRGVTVKRRSLLLTLLFALVTITAAFGSPALGARQSASHEPRLVRVLGTEDFEANSLIFSTFRFSPERFFPHSGERMRWINDAKVQAPHTITIVRKRDLPTSFDGLFACEPCNAALEAHFAGPEPVLRVEDDANAELGLDEPGDSLFLAPGGAIGSAITAAPGSTLNYLCAIHPWMQGRLVVG